MATYTQVTRAGAKLLLPITGTARNVEVKLDDHGYMASLIRTDGESTTNFKSRLASTYTRPANATTRGLTDAIASELGLGHKELISVTSDRPLKLDVDPEYIWISGATTNKVAIINVDVDGFWVLNTVGKVVSGLNAIAGVTATTAADTTELPAALLEEQSSYVRVYGERIPYVKNFRLGYYNHGQEIVGLVVSGTVAFTDDVTFATQVVGEPVDIGQWSLEQQTNTIKVYELPRSSVNVSYTRSILETNMTMSLIGNGVKVMNLMLSGVQNMMFHNSGIGYTGQTIVDELRVVDGAFWGK